MKKAYIAPQTTAVLIAAATMLAASDPDKIGVNDTYINAAQLSNERSWDNEIWGEK